MTYSPSLRGSTPEELNGDSSLPTSTHRLLCLDSHLYTPGAGLRYPLRIRFAFFGFAGMRTPPAKQAGRIPLSPHRPTNRGFFAPDLPALAAWFLQRTITPGLIHVTRSE